jgi:hypothetical protein
MDIDQQKIKDDTARVILSDLSVPFDVSLRKQRTVQGPQGPRQLDYYDLMTVVDRLNEFAPGWCATVKSQDVHPFGTTNSGNPRLMLTALVAVYIPGVGTRDHMGVQVVNADSGGEDLWKGAISDGIKKAASLFGVGRELYGEDPVTAPVQVGQGVMSAPQQYQQPRPQMQAGQRPPQQQVAIMQGGAGPSPAQVDLFTRLSYERGHAYEAVQFALANSNRQEISNQIDALMKTPSIRRLERNEPVPQDWIDGTDEPPF